MSIDSESLSLLGPSSHIQFSKPQIRQSELLTELSEDRGDMLTIRTPGGVKHNDPGTVLVVRELVLKILKS